MYGKAPLRSRLPATNPSVLRSGNPMRCRITSPPGSCSIRRQTSLSGSPPAGCRRKLAAAVNSGGEAVFRLAIAWLLTAAFQREHQRQPFDIVEVADVDASGLPLLLDGGRPLPVIVHLHTCTAIAHRINHTACGPKESLIEAMEAAQIHLADALCAPTHAVVHSTEALVPLIERPETIPHPMSARPTISRLHRQMARWSSSAGSNGARGAA